MIHVLKAIVRRIATFYAKSVKLWNFTLVRRFFQYAFRRICPRIGSEIGSKIVPATDVPPSPIHKKFKQVFHSIFAKANVAPTSIRKKPQEYTVLIIALNANLEPTPHLLDLRKLLIEQLVPFGAFDALDSSENPSEKIIHPNQQMTTCRTRNTNFVAVPANLGSSPPEAEVISSLSRALRMLHLTKNSDVVTNSELLEVVDGIGLLEICEKVGLIKDIFALHHYDSEVDVTRYQSLLAYYGPQVVLYVMFMKEYQSWLVSPALVGIAAYFIRILNFLPKDYVSVLAFAYAIFITMWSTLFVEAWKRKIAKTLFRYDMEKYTTPVVSTEESWLEEVQKYIMSNKEVVEKPPLPRRSSLASLSSVKSNRTVSTRSSSEHRASQGLRRSSSSGSIQYPETVPGGPGMGRTTEFMESSPEMRKSSVQVERELRSSTNEPLLGARASITEPLLGRERASSIPRASQRRSMSQRRRSSRGTSLITDARKKKKGVDLSTYFHLTFVLFIGIAIVAVAIFGCNQFQSVVDQFLKENKEYSPNWGHLPTALYIGVMVIMEQIYDNLAKMLTKWEKLRLPHDATRSFMMKRCLFVYMNMFGFPLYVGLYQQNVVALRDCIFITVSIKQILFGTILEMLPLYFNTNTSDEAHKKKSKSPSDVMAQNDLEHSDVFSEYLEMFLDFGYIVFFSPYCEWVALWSLIHTTLELTTDSIKFRMVRRFFGDGSFDARDLALCFEGASLAGVVVSAIYCIAMLPKEYAVIVLAVEHIVIFFKLFLGALIPDEPQSVTIGRMLEERHAKMD